jgi:2-polyprenyl-3-methyl-5-hydroxy-6-metoxy-1,4-benzoquinol methylase
LTNTLDSAWWDFFISSYNGNTWMKHCSGQIRAGQEAPAVSRAIEKHTRPVSDPYTIMKKVGLNYGPAFQGLLDCSALPAGKTASATLRHAVKPGSHYIMHPTTIDHCLQIIVLAKSDGLGRCLDKLCVPTGIDYLYVGPYSEGYSMRAEATASVTSTGMTHGDVVGVSGGIVNFSLLGGQFSPLETDSSNKDADRIAGSRLVWKPHLDFMSLGDFVRPNKQSRHIQEDMEKLTLLSIAEIQRRLTPFTPQKEFLQKFKTWINEQIGNAERNQYALVPNSKKLFEMMPEEQLLEIEQLEASLRDTECGPAAQLVSRVRSSCSDIINETVEGIELLLPDDGLTRFYNALEARTDCKDFFGAAGHLKPTLRVLEIGAGTGGTSAVVLKSLTSDSSRMYSKYTYTDVSSGFFATAQERFKSYDGIEYKVLDVSRDPIAQGFEEGSYDLIVAANVLHATPSLHETLSNVRKLLATDGRVFLQELSPEVKSVNL